MQSTSTLLSLLESGVSPFHAADYAAGLLEEAGFTRLPFDAPWSLVPGGRYVTVASASHFFAFVLGKNGLGSEGPRLAASHIDWPCFKIKRRAEMPSAGVCRIDVEPYGGQIFSTWMDRPLSAAGIVCLKGSDPFAPETRLFDFRDPVFVIPNLAIHMNRKVNDGVPLNPAKDLLPICHIMEEGFEKDGYLDRRIAEKIGCAPEDILSYDLGIYNTEKPVIQGFDGEFLTSPRLDNLTSLAAALDGIRASAPEYGLRIAIGFDHEEVGSKSRQGADSMTVAALLEKITASLGLSRAEHLDFLMKGFLLSCDVAHAQHPNYPEYADPENHPVLGSGVSLKLNFRQKYPTDAPGLATIESLCRENGIPHQIFFNRSDLAGGGTIGAYATSHLMMRAVDIGVPILGMHSARETMAIRDQDSISRLVTVFLA